MKNQPVRNFRAGTVQAAVWKRENQSKEGAVREYYTVSLERRYRDQQGNWQSSHSFSSEDLPRASLLLEEAYRFIHLRDQVPVAGQMEASR